MMLQEAYEKYKETYINPTNLRRLMEDMFDPVVQQQYSNRKLQQCRFNPSDLKQGCITGGCSGNWPFTPLAVVGAQVEVKGQFCTNILELARDSRGGVREATIKSLRGSTTAPLDPTSFFFKSLTGQK